MQSCWSKDEILYAISHDSASNYLLSGLYIRHYPANTRMNKISTLLFFVTFLISGVSYSQQITIRDSALVIVSDDTVLVLNNNGAADSMGLPRSNGIWDLSMVQYNTRIGRYERKAPFAGNSYTTASFASRGFVFYSTDKHAINNYYSVGSGGIEWLGQNSFSRQVFSRVNVTGNSNDSLIFPAQTMPLSTPLKRLDFPATMGNSWGGKASYTTQLFVYSAIGNLVNTPISIITQIEITDTVVGWGKMRVRLLDSTKTCEYVPVLQVHEASLERDSFFMNGVVAPDSILNYLGLYQGKKKTNYFTKFFRAGEIEPLLSTLFVYPDHRGAITSSVVLMRLPLLLSSGVEHTGRGSLSIYPNPNKTRQLNIKWPGASGTLQYILSNFASATVATGITNLNQQLRLQESLPGGLYNLTLIDSKGHKEAVPLMLE
jgi:hypothetical protein